MAVKIYYLIKAKVFHQWKNISLSVIVLRQPDNLLGGKTPGSTFIFHQNNDVKVENEVMQVLKETYVNILFIFPTVKKVWILYMPDTSLSA